MTFSKEFGHEGLVKQKFNICINEGSWVWWYMPVIPVLRSMRQEAHQEFEASLGPCLKTRQNQTTTKPPWTYMAYIKDWVVRSIESLRLSS